MDRLGIEMLSVFGMPPLEYVHLTADLGCQYITVALVGFAPVKALDYPTFSLRDEPQLRKDLRAVMGDRGVSISLGEGLLIAPGVDVRSYAADLDVMAELEIPRINTVSLEPDRARAFDELAVLTALAAERGIATCVEPVVGLSIADLPSAIAAVEYTRGADRLHPTQRHHHAEAHEALRRGSDVRAHGARCGRIAAARHADGAAARSGRRVGDTDASTRGGGRQRPGPSAAVRRKCAVTVGSGEGKPLTRNRIQRHMLSSREPF
jgi:hypothetical protein